YLQHDLPGLRAHAAGGEADRRPGPDPRHLAGPGGRGDHADRAGHQAPDRTGRGRRARRLPLLRPRVVRQRLVVPARWRLVRPLALLILVLRDLYHRTTLSSLRLASGPPLRRLLPSSLLRR